MKRVRARDRGKEMETKRDAHGEMRDGSSVDDKKERGKREGEEESGRGRADDNV